MGGNWGNIPIRPSGGPRRRRIILAVASVVALVVLVMLARDFFGPGRVPGDVWYVVGLLTVGILWGLRPWSR
jgi:hypothetical protein